MAPWIRSSGIFGLVIFGYALFVGTLLAFTGGANGISSIFYGFIAGLQTPLLLAHFLLGFGLIVFWFFSSGVKGLYAARSATTGRVLRYGGYAVSGVVLFVAILVAGNWFANRYNKRLDLTEAGVYTLAPQSEAVVKDLKKPLKIVGLTGAALIKESKDPQEVRNLLSLYAQGNPSLITIETFDPQAKPHLIESYGFTRGNLLYLKYGEGDTAGVSRVNEVTEEAITNAILKLQRGDAKKIYALTGHGEPETSSLQPQGLKRAVDALRDDQLIVEDLFLAQLEGVPNDAAALLLASPKKPFVAGERERIISYIEGGGRVILLSDPNTSSEDLSAIAAHFGITIGKNVIIDQVQRLFGAPQLGAQPAVLTYGEHPITKDFNQRTPSIFNIASTVTSTKKSEGDTTYVELLKSSATAWGESDIAALFSEEPTATKGEDDLAGPVTIGVVYEKKVSTPEQKEGEQGNDRRARLVVIGDSDWALNANIDVLSNKDLLTNIVSWSAGEEAALSIRPRSMRESLAPIQRDSYIRILAASFVLPELLLLVGLFVWSRRRYMVAA
jgi:ABC-type uncharacterized transport system involved in gliding motility auxiliary subunit